MRYEDKRAFLNIIKRLVGIGKPFRALDLVALTFIDNELREWATNNFPVGQKIDTKNFGCTLRSLRMIKVEGAKIMIWGQSKRGNLWILSGQRPKK